MTTSGVTVERVVAGVERLLPGAGPVRPVAALRRRRGQVSWVLESRLGRVVGKVSGGGADRLVEGRLEEHRRAWRHGVPVPRVVAFDPMSAELGGRRLIVLEYLEGVDAEQGARSFSDRAMAHAMRETGGAVARLHQVPVPGFGDPATGLGAGPRGWGEVIAARIEALRALYRDSAGLDAASADLVRSGLVVLGEVVGDVSAMVRPALAHLDIHLPNVLLAGDGGFRALLDLEHLRWVDPVMDFVKPAMWMFPERPVWAEAFVEGYRATGDWPPRWSERLAVTTGLELLTGVDYWTRVRDHAMRADYLGRLARWVRSDGADSVWPATMT